LTREHRSPLGVFISPIASLKAPLGLEQRPRSERSLDLGNGKATGVGSVSFYDSFFGRGRFYLSTSCAIFPNLEMRPSVFHSWHSIR
jgi:hypothetical protein